MSRNLRIEAWLLVLLVGAWPVLARAQSADSPQVTVCVNASGAVNVVDPAASCNPGERRFALAAAQSGDGEGGSELVRNLVLLLATAITSGLLVPYILGRIDFRRSEQQRDRQARIARESKVIDAQARLLESLSRVLWRWRYLVMKITYYGARSDDPRYADACVRYDTRVWDMLSRFRLEVSRSQRLASSSVHAMLLEFYQLMVDTDKRIRSIQDLKDPLELEMALLDLNAEIFTDVTARIDAILNDAAREMGLAGAGAMLKENGRATG